MQKITALTTISHDGETYPKGSTLDVTDKQAAQLIKVGAAERLTQEKPAPAPAKK